MSVPRGPMSVPQCRLLVLSTEVVLHLRRSSVSWMIAQSLLHIVTKKMCGLNKQNLVAVATSLEHIDRLLHDAQQRGLQWANAGSATSSTYVGS